MTLRKILYEIGNVCLEVRVIRDWLDQPHTFRHIMDEVIDGTDPNENDVVELAAILADILRNIGCEQEHRVLANEIYNDVRANWYEF